VWDQDLAAANVALVVDPQACNAATRGFNHVEKLLVGVESDLVRESKAVGHDPKGAVLVTREVAVRQVGAERVHPVLDGGRDGNPDPIPRITQHEVHFADRFSVDRVR